MNWKERYADKLRTPDEAVKLVKSGDFVRFAEASMWQTCWSLAPALAKRAPELENVTIDSTWTMAAELGLLAPGTEKAWKTVTGFAYGGTERQKLTDRSEQTNFIPQWPSLENVADGPFREEMRKGLCDSDVCMIMITPPDKNGFVTFGCHLWHAKNHIKHAKIVIGEVNDKLPIVPGGDNWMPVEAFDYLVESTPLDIYGAMSGLGETPPEEQEASEVCCALISELINDGDTLMFGGGAIPMRVAPFLENKTDLGCHSEVVIPLDLIRKGVITNKKRTLCPGKTSCTGVGTMNKEDEAFIDGNPLFDLRVVETNNSPRYTCQNDNFVTINAPLEISFMGEIALERVGSRYFRGTGGQVELIMGALLSRGGRSIHGVLSRKLMNDGNWVSSIVPRFKDPAITSVPRAMSDFVVTEYGVAKLMGKTERERANELIAIAHPDFREELKKEMQKLL